MAPKPTETEAASSKEAYGIVSNILKSLKAHVSEALRGENHSGLQVTTQDRLLSYASKLAVIGGELRKGEIAEAKGAELEPSRVLEWLRRRTPAERLQLIAELEAMDRRKSVL